MELSWHRKALALLSYGQVIEAILERRRVIRDHRDQRDDDRCWLDDYKLLQFVEGFPSGPQKLPGWKLMLQSCERFYLNCNASESDPVPEDAILDPTHWDDDLLDGPPFEDMLTKLEMLQLGIYNLCMTPQTERTTDHYRALYDQLPEKCGIDFRLPPRGEFLEGTKTGAGCPNFWKSHESCDSQQPCRLDTWGPCRS